jgi:hypothetical protein
MIRFYLLSVLFALGAVSVRADYINLIQADQCESIIEIYVEDGQIRVTFEIGERDYPYFHQVIPGRYFDGGHTEPEKAGFFKDFQKNGFRVVADGRLLEGEVGRIERVDRIFRSSLYTGKVDTSNTTISPFVVFVEIVYAIEGRPDHISVTPPMESGYDVTLANIGFVAFHKNIPVNDLRYMSQEINLNLDWNDPWYSRFDNRNLTRHHRSSLMSYLYVEPYEVRHEMVVRIKDLEQWIEMPWSLDDYVEIEQQDSLKAKIAEFLASRNHVKIDGELVPPIIDRVHFIQVALSGIQILEDPIRQPYSSAIVGVILAYPTGGIPGEVTIDWDMFSETIQTVPTISTDPAGPMPYILTPDDSVLVWTNYLKTYVLPTISEVKITNAVVRIPVFSILLVLILGFLLYRSGWQFGALFSARKKSVIVMGIIAIVLLPIGYDAEIPFLKKNSFSRPESAELISSLLKNTYRAFDFREESDIYDKLAVSSEGDLLATIYLQTRQSMEIENQGGAQAKVKDVTLLQVEEVSGPDDGLAYRCQWQVSGTVGHWGHLHNRTNQYDAVINVRPVNGVWKLRDLDIIEEIRL